MNRMTLALAVLVSMLAGIAAAWWLGERGPPPEHATVLAPPRPLPELSLVDQTGAPFRRDRLEGRWSLLFFGFTHCPDICPTTLAELAEVRRLLGDLAPAEQPRVVFVSVDPARDSPAALARYVAHFDPAFTGVTGDAAAIRHLTQALGLPVFIGAPATDGSYAVDHGAAIFIVDPEAAWRAVSSAPHSAEGLALDYRRIVAAADLPVAGHD